MPPRSAPPPPVGVDDLVARRELWPVPAAAERLGVSRRTIERERDRGRLAIVHIGGRAFVSEKEILRYLDALEAEAAS